MDNIERKKRSFLVPLMKKHVPSTPPPPPPHWKSPSYATAWWIQTHAEGTAVKVMILFLYPRYYCGFASKSGFRRQGFQALAEMPSVAFFEVFCTVFSWKCLKNTAGFRKILFLFLFFSLSLLLQLCIAHVFIQNTPFQPWKYCKPFCEVGISALAAHGTSRQTGNAIENLFFFGGGGGGDGGAMEILVWFQSEVNPRDAIIWNSLKSQFIYILQFTAVFKKKILIWKDFFYQCERPLDRINWRKVGNCVFLKGKVSQIGRR